MRERDFQKKLIKEVKKKFPGCIVLKNDSTYIQGIPDLLVLHGKRWAALECKKSEKAAKSKNGKRPNQDYYIQKMNNMSYASFVYPENKKGVMDALERTFRP